MIRAAALRYALAASLTLALPLAARDAAAQGTCRCNGGCHQYPGQCVSAGGSGCETGYAPFCGTRGGSCPNIGWVSCNGMCTCVRVASTDAGGVPTDAPGSDVVASLDVPVSRDVVTTSDVPASFDVPGRDAVSTVDAPAGTDVPGRDVPPGTDVVTPTDVPPGTDVVSTTDVPPGTDVVSTTDAPPGTDVVTPTDVPPGTDVVTTTDAPPGTDVVTPTDAPAPGMDAVSLSDASSPRDACVCDGGVCYLDTCLQERCRFEMELGFICPVAGMTCRVVGDEAWCAPPCLGVTCDEGSVCDTRYGGCRENRCDDGGTCGAGYLCANGLCVSQGDGGALSDASPAGDAAAPGVQDGGCGCRAATGRSGGFGAALLAACAVLVARRRRRAA